MNMPRMTMDVKRETAAEDKSNGSLTTLFKPLPDKAGTSFMNELFIPLFQPDKWKLFNKTPEEAHRLGMIPGNPLVLEGADPLWTFYFKIPTHPVQNFMKNDGTTCFASIVCPIAMNKYMIESLGRKAMYSSPSCPFCEATSKAWDKHNKRWVQIEQERGIKKKDLNKDGYLEVRKSDLVLSETYEEATKFRIQDKNILIVFDHSKYSGKRAMAEGQESVAYETWFAPKTVVDYLKELYSNNAESGGALFFDFGNPEGFKIMNIKKDTTKCQNNNMRDTAYTIMDGPLVQFEGAWKDYICNLESMPDPTDFILTLPVEEMRVYADKVEETMNQQAPAAQQSVPASAPQMNAPVQTPAPAPAAPAPPTQAPPMPATVPASGGVPVAPQTPAPAPSAPQAPPMPTPPGASAPAPMPPVGPPTAAPPMPAPQAPAPTPTKLIPGASGSLPDRMPPSTGGDTEW